MRQDTSRQARRHERVRGGFALAAIVLATLALAACGSSDSGDDTTTAKTPGSDDTTTEAPGSAVDQLDGTQFTATDVTAYEPVAGSELTLTFDGGQLSVNAGCNTLGSSYTFADGTLAWTGEPRATMMACSDDLMAQDAWLTELFTAGVEAELDGTTLTLTSDDVVITLEAVGDATLTGTAWTLDGLIADDAVSSLPDGAEPPTLTIGEDGSAQLFTGCNTGSTTVAIADDTLTFDPIAMTRMFCEGAGSELEGQVTTVLDGEVTYTIEGDTLTIMNGETGLVYRVG